MSKVFLNVCLLVLVGFLAAPSSLMAATEVTLVDESPSSQEAIGNNWLLAIGINNYRNWPQLATSVSDAKSLANVLLEDYYFKEKCLIELYNEDATRSAVLRKMAYLSKQLQPEDSLVIFFSGHGYINPTTKKGSWIPVDGDAINPRHWISNDEIIKMIQPDSIKAKHVLVIVDSAFSAENLVDDPDGPANLSREAIETAYDSPSRQIISSCYRIPVIQKGFPTTSVFTRSLIEVLKANVHRFLPISACYNDLKKNIHDNSGKDPLFSRLSSSDGQGDFIFILNKKVDRNNPSLFLAARKKEVNILTGQALKSSGYKQLPSEKTLAFPEENDRFKKEFERIAKESKTTVKPRLGLHVAPPLEAPLPEPEAKIPETAEIQPLPEAVVETAPEAPIEEPIPTADDTPVRNEAETDMASRSKPLTAPVGHHMLENRLGMAFRYVGPGTFTMGSSNGDSDENPHKVTLTRGFYLQTTEVTQAQWTALMGNNPSNFPDCGRNCPVENVSWEDVQRFIEKLNIIENGPRYRLPTETEWEYACRAGSTSDYSTHTSVAELCWFDRNSDNKTHPVASKQANNWGFSDMHGNVWEWCASTYKPYPTKDVTDPEESPGGYYKVQRGGSWDESVYVCRSANRMYNEPAFKRNDTGFRLVRIQ